MIKEHINLKEIRILAIDILDHVDSKEEFGHVGCYAITKEEVENISNNIIENLNESLSLLEELGSKIIESYEY